MTEHLMYWCLCCLTKVCVAQLTLPLPVSSSGACRLQLPVSAGIRHSSGSAFLPASGSMLGARHLQSQPTLQMALVPVAVPTLPHVGLSPEPMVSPWSLSQPQPIRPAACTAEQVCVGC